VPHSFSAAARVFCRDAADHFPTISDAVASPNFNDPAIRNRSGQQSTMRSALRRVLSSGPACGYRALTALGVSSRHMVIFPRSRIRGVNAFPTRSNRAKLISVTPCVSVACSRIGRSVALPRKSSRTKCASRAVGTMIFVP
jgi:hypothetical protein